MSLWELYTSDDEGFLEFVAAVADSTINVREEQAREARKR